MTKYIFTLIFFFVLTIVKAQDPNWKLTSALGMEVGSAIPIPLPKMPDEADAHFKIRPTLGVGFLQNIDNRWSLGVETSYHIIANDVFVHVVSQTFWSDDRSYATYFSGEAYSSTELQFVAIPLTAYYHFNERWSLVFGGYFSIITKAEMKTEGRNGWISANKNDTDTAPLPGTQNTSYNFNDELNNYDTGALIGYEFKIGEKVNLWGRLNVGFKDIFKPEFHNIDYDMYQFRISTGVSLVLWTNA